MKKLYAKIFAMLALAFSLSNLAFGQELEVSGKVTDAKDGSGLPGVNVLVVGTTNGAISDINGSYKLKAGIGAILEFRFLGFTTERRTVVASAVIDVSLSEEVKNLKEAVVIGYGQVRKKDLTGSLSNVTSKDFQTGINTTPEALIAGKVAGVQITNNGGSPGSGSTIRIRGGASLNASNDPLIIIDGVPVEGGGVSGSPNALSLINPNDIESFTVLKDASATAIYGSRASNGVIIITTKKGSVNQLRPTITLSTQNSVSQPYRFVDVLSGDEFRAMVKQYGTPAQKKLIDTAGTTNTDWQKEIYRLAYTTDNNLSFSGNLKFKEGYNLPYRISGGYLNQQGILKRDQMDRFTGGINLSPVLLNGDLKVNLNFKIARTTNFFANRGAIGSAVVFDPTKPVNATRDSLGNAPFGGYFEWADNTGKTPLSLAPKNPVGLLNSREDKSEVNRILTNVQLDYAIPFLKDLRANLNIGTDRSEGKGTVKVDSIYASDFVRKGVNNNYLQKKQNNLLEFYFNYNKEIKEISSRFDVVAGYGYQDFLTNVYNYADFRYNGDTMPNSKPVFATDKPQNRLISYYGRLNYVLMEKFLITGTVRTDGSSRFGNDVRWGFFPSVAGAYTLSEESFIKKIPAINQLKIRVGYGLTGQQDIGSNYAYLPTYRLTNPSAQYQFGDQYYYGYRPSAYDPRIKWEQTATTNAAVDFSLFSDRVSGSVDFYLKETSNLLNTIPTPAGANFSDQVLTNVGSIENRGVEININTIPVQTKDLTWNFGFNVTMNRNRVTKLTAVADSSYPGIYTGGIDGGVGSTIQIHSVGYPTNSFLVYRQVYKDGKPVEGQFEDLNGDGRINEDDQYHYKQAAPTSFYGINTSVQYKKLTVGLVLRGSFGNYVYNNIYSDKGNRNAAFIQTGYVNNISANYLETGFTGKPVGGASTDQTRLSDYFVQNASFLRFDNIFLSYNFGEITKKFSLAANFNVQNAFFISNYEGIDPEIGGGIDNNFYPRPRVFTLGLTANFMP
jgi:TonB-dependent starch-binding outer membrane protein SusC